MNNKKTMNEWIELLKDYESDNLLIDSIYKDDMFITFPYKGKGIKIPLEYIEFDIFLSNRLFEEKNNLKYIPGNIVTINIITKYLYLAILPIPDDMKISLEAFLTMTYIYDVLIELGYLMGNDGKNDLYSNIKEYK